jgi:hypothetical protein
MHNLKFNIFRFTIVMINPFTMMYSGASLGQCRQCCRLGPQKTWGLNFFLFKPIIKLLVKYVFEKHVSWNIGCFSGQSARPWGCYGLQVWIPPRPVFSFILRHQFLINIININIAERVWCLHDKFLSISQFYHYCSIIITICKCFLIGNSINEP